MEYKANKLIIANTKVKYIFLNWEGFYNRLTQIYNNLEVTVIAKYKLQELI